MFWRIRISWRKYRTGWIIDAAATVTVAGLTAYQSIVPYMKKGGRIFINGGSGGTGTFGIQIAKVLGCHVTTTCSSANLELCQGLGADEVIDYTKRSVLEALKEAGQAFDHVVDNVASARMLCWKAHEYTKPEALYIFVGGTPSLRNLLGSLDVRIRPTWLGGCKRQVKGFWPSTKVEDLEQILQWMREGKVKAIIDQRFVFEQAPQALEKLRTSRAKGKIVVEVAGETGLLPE